ncbi:hypothetical protein SAMN05443574_106226 [Haloarcula vallismortis]|uniref:Uncharacterized protein n=2 Tax=Haloarcula vallismortis TaxID=28442 RepID=M0JIS7_HALVA|nr:hypothetical protein [Haloarcula vallismortis]EMA07580.1 hypothetical protein C437_09048 [Haloarcula vallismortis ATCC 29715]SDW76987.1 hypothetical protein SAMN05443574_106226 [Haloarcula vallismortis]
MGAVTTSLDEQARSIFDELGYTVSRTGTELQAERGWRVVTVSALGSQDPIPESGDLRCFVTRTGEATHLSRRLNRLDVSYDWAVIEITEDGDYEVIRHPGDTATSTDANT